uniref:Uncharacterized protein n=1 Tax=Nelumbo nucifera TaxID=4432 RepID=A0A822YIZ1_NELNU|nr:TPA_asm: hypothetical protein HUJ06_011313 [Nelumbo nucifera]
MNSGIYNIGANPRRQKLLWMVGPSEEDSEPMEVQEGEETENPH